ncbi:MAG: glycosyltransferase [Cyanobacteria bacterium]|nr:glycosyltransferase [Cyanobacteriota bacterium]
MNVAIVCDGIGDVVGGSFISTLRFGELLKARGHKVVFVSSGSRRHPRTHEYRGIKTYRLFGVLIPWSEGQLYLAMPFVPTIRKILRDEQIDIVHVMIPMPLGLAAVRVAKAMDVPVVMHSHTQPENIFMNVPAFPGRDALHGRFCAYLNWIYRQSDVLIYPSAFSQRQLPALAASRHVVISNGVNRERFRPTSPDPFLRRFSLSSTRQHLMYLGRLHREKNVETLIRAMAILRQHHPQTHLVIVGFGYEQPALERLAHAWDLTAHVTFCGFVPDEHLAAAYSACDLFVLPSLAELEGMAVLEAMACGKPILIADSKDSAATDFVDGNGLLFRARDPAHLAAQAGYLLSDPERLRSMADRSLEKSRSFEIHESAAAIESLYYSLLPAP